MTVYDAAGGRGSFTFVLTMAANPEDFINVESLVKAM
jgi:hypothetical protein